MIIPISRFDHGVVLTIRTWAIATGQGRLSTLGLFGQEFLHTLLRAKDVIHGVEILNPPFENLLGFFGQRNDLDLIKTHGFVFSHRVLISSRDIEPAFFVVSENVVGPDGTYFIRTHASVPDEFEHEVIIK